MCFHFALQWLELACQREHQRDGTLGDRFLGILGNVDDRDAPAPRRLEVDGIDADAILDDTLQPRRVIDDLRRNLRITHQQQIRVAQFRGEPITRDRIGQHHEICARFTEHTIDVR